MIHNILKEYQMMEFLEFAVKTSAQLQNTSLAVSIRRSPALGNVQYRAALKEKKSFQ